MFDYLRRATAFGEYEAWQKSIMRLYFIRCMIIAELGDIRLRKQFALDK
jgi:hypothetical protein